MYRGDKWWVSPYNTIDEVRKELKIPEKVEIHDVTLRDGEQTVGVVFNKEDKLTISKLLDEIGVHRIEAGMPVISAEEKDAIKAITRENLRAKIFVLSRLIQGDVDAALETEVDGIILEAPIGVPKLMQFEGWDLNFVEDLAIKMIDYAKSHGLYVVFFGVDTTRTEPNKFNEFIKKIDETKADAIAIVDTYGCITVEGMKYLVRKVREITKKPIEVHTHNDFGLSTATTIAAISEGASVAHVAINGIGERTGNASLEEVVMGLKLLYGVNLSIKTEKLYELSREVEKRSGFKIALNKPIVGYTAFARESGISVAGWMKYALGSEAILPELVGNTHKVIIGKKSGRHSIIYKMRELGIDDSKFDEIKIKKILEDVKQKSENLKRALTDNEFLEIVKKNNA
jgi:methanogen homocitrate synthase